MFIHGFSGSLTAATYSPFTIPWILPCRRVGSQGSSSSSSTSAAFWASPRLPQASTKAQQAFTPGQRDVQGTIARKLVSAEIS